MTLDLPILEIEPVTGPVGIPPIVARRFGPTMEGGCRWFAQCGNGAQIAVPHSMYGHVNACLDCAEKVCDLLSVLFQPPREALQWTNSEGWTYPSKPTSPADFQWRWRTADGADDFYALQWYDDATREWVDSPKTWVDKAYVYGKVYPS